MEPTIVAIGGAPPTTVRDGRQIEDYLLALTGKDDPRVCYLPTASGDSIVNVVRFYENFDSDRCRPSHLMLVNRSVTDLRAYLLRNDIIYVGGGNTAAMLAIWRQHGLDEILRDAWQRGIILCGGSAGANCWFDSCMTDSFGMPYRPLNDGLGFLGGSFCPHYDGEAARKPIYRQAVADGTLADGYACDNGVAVRYEGRELAEFIASRPDVRAWRLSRTSGGYEEAEIVPRYLGESLMTVRS